MENKVTYCEGRYRGKASAYFGIDLEKTSHGRSGNPVKSWLFFGNYGANFVLNPGVTGSIVSN